MNRESLEPRPRFSWPIALTLIVSISAITLLVIFFRLESWPARTAKQGTAEFERVARQVRDAFVEVGHLQPRITVNDRVYLEKTSAIAELTVLSRQIEVEHELLHTWAGSTKRIKLHGTFTAKAGFNLQQEVAVDVRPNEITVHLPHATLLGLEQSQTEVLAFENGFWNHISPSDLESELAVLPELARRKAYESGILAESEATFQAQLNQRLQPDRQLTVLFQDASTKK